MGVWKQVGQNLAGLAKHVVKSVASEPMEVVKDAVGVQNEKGQNAAQPTALPAYNAERSTAGRQSGGQVDPMTDLAKAGFKTQDDFQKYQGLSGQKDQLELQMARKQLAREWGLDTNLESGMQRARMEYEQKEEQRKKIEEKKEEQKKEFEFQQKKQEDIALKAAKQGSSAENKAWGAG